jgi:hypothetical protein
MKSTPDCSACCWGYRRAHCDSGLQFMRDSHNAGTGKAYCIPDGIGDYAISVDTGSFYALSESFESLAQS